MSRIIITKAQLAGLKDYMDLYGVDALAFESEQMDEDLESFGPKQVELDVGILHWSPVSPYPANNPKRKI